MKFPSILLPFVLTALITSCGKPPSGGGGPPQGDFPMDVVGAPVTVEPLSRSIDLVGSFEAPDRVSIISEITGEVLELPVEEGAFVEKGTLLVDLDRRKLSARLAEAKSRLTLAEATLRRVAELWESRSISEQEVDEARAAVDQARASIDLLEAQLEDTRIHARMDGVVGEHEISRGQVVQAGQTLMDLVRLDPLEIRFEVPERYLSAMEPGLTVRIETDPFPDEVFEGTVTFLASQVRASTRTLLVKARVPNADHRLKPGMFGNVRVVLSREEEALFVPESAVAQNGARTTVMVRNDQGRSEAREVEIGVRQGGRMQILEGLRAEDVVVAEGRIKVRPGQLLNFTADSRAYGLEPSPAPTPAPTPASSGENAQPSESD